MHPLPAQHQFPQVLLLPHPNFSLPSFLLSLFTSPFLPYSLFILLPHPNSPNFFLPSLSFYFLPPFSLSTYFPPSSIPNPNFQISKSNAPWVWVSRVIRFEKIEEIERREEEGEVGFKEEGGVWERVREVFGVGEREQRASVKPGFPANSWRVADSAVQLGKHSQRLINTAGSAGQCSPASILALANIHVSQMGCSALSMLCMVHAPSFRVSESPSFQLSFQVTKRQLSLRIPLGTGGD
ncbi:hypothetical protein F5879DRAFT_1035179 [Lentinula edodes]|nr:hypothetical protein F5879DRAFT_1035179 [Lentinula edodes]